VLKSLDEAALRKLVHRALTEERGLGKRNLPSAMKASRC
jgi:putative ATPase